MIYLRQSTASQEIAIGQFLDSTDGDTEEAGLTIANTDIKIWKTGATTLANKNSGGATYISNGVYYAVLDATDTDTLGSGIIFVHVQGALVVRLEFCVITANWYDTMFSTDILDVNTTHVAGTAQTGNDNGADINAILVDTDDLQTNQGAWATATGFATSGALATHDGKLDTIDGIVDAILVDTGEIGTAGAGLTNINLPNQTMDIVGDITGNLSGSVGSVSGTVTLADGSLTAAKIGADAITAAKVAADVHAETADSVWDEVLTGATHNIATSSGRRLRDIASNIVLTGTSPDTAGTANTAIRVELDGAGSSTDGAYDPAIVVITAGTGVGQSRQVFEYDGTNKYCYINRSWKVIPDNTSEYTIVGDSGDTHVNEGLATGGGSTTIIFNSLASAVDDTYIGQVVFLSAGTGEDQARNIIDYNGTTKVATVERAWETNPANGATVYSVLPRADLTTLKANIAALNDFDPAVDTVALVTDITTKTGFSLSTAGIDSILDEQIGDGTITMREALRGFIAVLAGKSSGGATATLIFRDDADSKDVITATVDANGNRTAVTFNP